MPPKDKEKCAKRSKKATGNQLIIECDNCEHWFHCTCVGLNKTKAHWSHMELIRVSNGSVLNVSHL